MYLLYTSESPALAVVFISLSVLLSINGAFFNYLPRLNAFIVWFIFGNIYNAIYTTLTAGETLFLQLLFFNIFLSGQKKIKNESRIDADKALHNFAIIAIIVQICIVYFYSGLAKALDHDWISGKAITQVCQIQHYSIPFLYENAQRLYDMKGILKFLTYFVMAYQLLFPILIWFKKIKNWFLLLGILQHLYIAFIMGLPSFGFIMIISYSIFYFPELKKSEKSL